MKRRKFLYVFALSAGLFSLASCQGTPGIQGEQGIQGEKGDKGDKGETGATGAKGETGENGKDGIDGKDGASLLTGDGAPKNTLGNNGDTYLDLKTYDLYKKVEGEWVKEGNIKGSNGYNASNYYSSTILPSNYGYVVPSKGSATYGESITYTVYVEDTEKVSKALQLFVDGKAVKLDKVNDTTYAYETTMKQNGHVVQAKFYDNTSLGNNITNGGEYVLLGDANLSTAGKFTTRFSTLSRFKTFRQAYGTINVSNSLGINLNGKTLDLGSNSLVIENGADFALTSSSDEEGTKGTLVSSGDNVIEIKANDNSKSSVSIDSGTKISSRSTSSSASAIKVEGGEIEIKGEVSSNYGTALSVSGGKAEISGTIESQNGIGAVIEGGSLEVKTGVISGATNGVKVTDGSVTIKENGTIESTSSNAAISVIKSSESNIEVDVTSGIIQNVNGGGSDAISESGDGGNSSIKKDTTTTFTYVKDEASLEAALSGDNPISLLNNIQLSKILSINKDVVIYGNNKTINAGTDQLRVFNVNLNTNDINMDFKNLNLKVSKIAYDTRIMSLYGNEGKTKITLDNCSFNCNYYPLNVGSYNDIEVIVKNSTLKGYCASQTWSENSKFTFENCTLIGQNDFNYDADGDNDFATFVINEGAKGSIINFKGCKMIANSSTGNQEAFLLIGDDSTINFENCTFEQNGTILTSLDDISNNIACYEDVNYNLTIK